MKYLPAELPCAYLARTVYYAGQALKLHYVRLDSDGIIHVYPFTKEEPGAKFVDGTINVISESSRVVLLVEE